MLSPHSSSDPRSSSTQSLVSSPLETVPNRRTLLLIYIHGFLGNETSFKSFPAHVHNVLAMTLGDRYTVHTKIYPRYKSRKPIEIASSDFSKWLAPHESPATDIILLGHSMGGLLSAEVALLRSPPPYNNSNPFRHRIIGTINFDTPFCGLHPGIIVSGLSSLFRGKETGKNNGKEGTRENRNSSEYGGSSESLQINELVGVSPSPPSYSSLSATPPPLPPRRPASQPPASFPPPPPTPIHLLHPDPTYNPAFNNDVYLPRPRGFIPGALHFLRKHRDTHDVRSATKSYVIDHLQFGGCLADWRGLKDRWKAIRTLEEEETMRRGGWPRRRFINYYTTCNGRRKRPKKENNEARDAGRDAGKDTMNEEQSNQEEKRYDEIVEGDVNGEKRPMNNNIPAAGESTIQISIDEDDTTLAPTSSVLSLQSDSISMSSNPEFDTLSSVTTLNETLPDIETNTMTNVSKSSTNISEPLTTTASSASVTTTNYADSEATSHSTCTSAPSTIETESSISSTTKAKAKKPPKKRKFCLLPPTNPHDPTWFNIDMGNVSEVGAHCGLFIYSTAQDPKQEVELERDEDGVVDEEGIRMRYERLVSEVVERVEGWVAGYDPRMG
ncbi:MAG: hypothetical protein M1834_008382 [Cirrosporium novae-zelandiae]|nr:MAG: hypothetical protein M1834_008382 [Cirrosporium novae-zelandiae]